MLGDVGWVQDVIVNQRTGRLVDGHLRVELALQRDEPTVPVVYVDLTAEEEKLVLTTLDPIGALAIADGDALAALLAEIESGDADVQALLEAIARDNGVAAKLAGDDPGADVDRKEDLREQWDTKPGARWDIESRSANGMHRLVCGDSGDAGLVESLFANDPAAWMWTDPPYGVNYVGKTAAAMTLNNDCADGLPALLTKSFGAANAVLGDGAPVYVCHPAGAIAFLFYQAFLGAGWHLHQSLIWVKDSPVLGHSDYHFAHEPMLYGWKPGPHAWHGGRNQTSIFSIPRPKRSLDHPTAKPVALVAAQLRNSSLPGERGHDPFAGSGTTIVAAEQTGRLCSGIEIDPGFCAVTLERLSGMGLVIREVS
jgi:DNA modification methylase